MDTIKQIRTSEILKPVKIENQNIRKFENLNFADEYTGLSYLNNQNNNNINNIHLNNNLNFSLGDLKAPKKNSEIDFRVKYKTEKCKFWEINKSCKFGEGVKIFLF